MKCSRCGNETLREVRAQEDWWRFGVTRLSGAVTCRECPMPHRIIPLRSARVVEFKPRAITPAPMLPERVDYRSAPYRKPRNANQPRRVEVLYRQQDGICAYCDRKMILASEFEDKSGLRCTIDHIVPTSKGGTNHPSNLIGACYRCNNLKGDRPVEEFLERHFRAAASA